MIGLEPSAIVGDLDSVPENLKQKYANRVFFNPDQDTNDLTKAILWCNERGFKSITILAGTGKRDDHTIGNIGLLTRYCKLGLDVKMVTDFGTFVPLLTSARLESYTGQQVSIFSFNNATRITTRNLKYPIADSPLPEPWMGTLNESLGEWFEIEFDAGSLIVFQNHT
jgi:thiamine pyrophosphokinase